MSKFIRFIYQYIIWSIYLINFSFFMFIGYLVGTEFDYKITGLAIGFTIGLYLNFLLFGIHLLLNNLDKNLETVNCNIKYIKEIFEEKQTEEQIKKYIELINDNARRKKGTIYDQNGIYRKLPGSEENNYA